MKALDQLRDEWRRTHRSDRADKAQRLATITTEAAAVKALADAGLAPTILTTAYDGDATGEAAA